MSQQAVALCPGTAGTTDTHVFVLQILVLLIQQIQLLSSMNIGIIFHHSIILFEIITNIGVILYHSIVC